MNLDELTETLQRDLAARGDRVVGQGFADPDSYRGFYEQLAFAPARNVTVSSMLEHARRADGATFHGWKGGEYTMYGSTTVHLAHRGECGENGENGDEIDDLALRLMLDSARVSEPTSAVAAATEPSPGSLGSVAVTIHLNGATVQTGVALADARALADIVRTAWEDDRTRGAILVKSANGAGPILVRLSAVQAVQIDDADAWATT